MRQVPVQFVITLGTELW